ncbi:MAG TPA: SirB2 family protein [Burkholderiales bacterium]|nr:SirB2 family protein [Burkholderiales bacterium]
MTTYVAIKYVHAVAVAVSLGLFFLRGVWMMLDSERLGRRWVRVVPHVNDTVLLAAGVWLAFVLRLSPATPWLAAKLIALPVHIGLGALALRPGRPKRLRVAAWMAALTVFGYIVAVAVTRSASL